MDLMKHEFPENVILLASFCIHNLLGDENITYIFHKMLCHSFEYPKNVILLALFVIHNLLGDENITYIFPHCHSLTTSEKDSAMLSCVGLKTQRQC